MSTTARAIGPAFVVAAMIYGLGSESGAHFNPAVTVAFAARTSFPWRWVPPYVGAQLVGAVGGAAVLHLILPPGGHRGTTYPKESLAASYGMECVLTLMVVMVVLAAATEHRLLGPDAALPTGATIAAVGFIGLPISGPSMNPARSAGPAIVAGISRDQWIYVAGPLTGALLAVALTSLARGRPKDEEHIAAEGERNVAPPFAARATRVSHGGGAKGVPDD